ncbi:hypothetical protein OWV82_008116 [Melia azedarach]|uniref:Uncharacterized protein n=1 Tax=Melia azedarach TaxID=155640 RepID=A0ACC1YCE1_MELAZ|nr:hypothetical protein OWV82_008116 [Melia azedarach]
MYSTLHPVKLWVNFMGSHLHLGWQDPEKSSKVSLINQVLMVTLERRMIYDEKFKFEIVNPSDSSKMVVINDDDLFRAWKYHNDTRSMVMKVILEILPLETLPPLKRSLFPEDEQEGHFPEARSSSDHFQSPAQSQAPRMATFLTQSSSIEGNLNKHIDIDEDNFKTPSPANSNENEINFKTPSAAQEGNLSPSISCTAESLQQSTKNRKTIPRQHLSNNDSSIYSPSCTIPITTSQPIPRLVTPNISAPVVPNATPRSVCQNASTAEPTATPIESSQTPTLGTASLWTQNPESQDYQPQQSEAPRTRTSSENGWPSHLNVTAPHVDACADNDSVYSDSDDDEDIMYDANEGGQNAWNQRTSHVGLHSSSQGDGNQYASQQTHQTQQQGYANTTDRMQREIRVPHLSTVAEHTTVRRKKQPVCRSKLSTGQLNAANASNDSNWVGVQGKKILAAGGVVLQSRGVLIREHNTSDSDATRNNVVEASKRKGKEKMKSYVSSQI